MPHDDPGDGHPDHAPGHEDDEAALRTVAIEEIADAWRRGQERGAPADALAAASIATAFSTIVASYGREAALAIADRFRDQIEAGAFDGDGHHHGGEPHGGGGVH